MNKFKYQVIMKVNNEDNNKLESSDFYAHLHAAGYKIQDSISPITDMQYEEFIEVNPFLYAIPYKDGELRYGRCKKSVAHKQGLTEKVIFIKQFNMELFLACAHITEGEDWIIGEYLVYKSVDKIFQCKDNTQGHNSYLGFATNKAKDIYRKATPQELARHFSTSIEIRQKH